MVSKCTPKCISELFFNNTGYDNNEKKDLEWSSYVVMCSWPLLGTSDLLCSIWVDVNLDGFSNLQFMDDSWEILYFLLKQLTLFGELRPTKIFPLQNVSKSENSLDAIRFIHVQMRHMNSKYEIYPYPAFLSL